MIGSSPRRARRLLIALSLISGAAAPALAQPPEEPIGRYVVDARVSLVPFSRNVELADLRELRPLDTPGLGLGFDVGAHTYVFRLGVITFGVGGSLHYSVADQQPGERSPDPDGPTLRKRFTAFSSQLSFNFGGRDGWSYLSGGLGASRLSLYPLDAEEPPQRMTNTLNYGGGVRWFTSDRLAFSLDLRFYAISPLPQFEEQPGSPRMTQMALNAGVSLQVATCFGAGRAVRPTLARRMWPPCALASGCSRKNASVRTVSSFRTGDGAPGAAASSLTLVCDHNAPMQRSTLLDFFDDRIRSDRPFLVYDGGYRACTYTYDEIRRAAGSFAERLQRAGIRPRDNVLLWGENRAEWIVAFWGCLLARAVAVPIDVRASPELVARVAGIVSAPLVVAGKDLPVPALAGVDAWPLDDLLEDAVLANLTAPGTPFPDIAAGDSDPTAGRDSGHGQEPGGGGNAERSRNAAGGNELAEIIFTSGATAEPKGVRITHANVLANIVPVEREVRKYFKYGRPFFPLRFLNLLPLSHMFGQAMATFVPPMLEGITVFMRGYNPEDIVRQIRARRVSVLVCVPKILEVLRDHVVHVAPETAEPLPKPEHVARRWWRYRKIHRIFGYKFWSFVVGAAPLDPEVEAFWSRLGFLVIQGYGLTETAPIVTLNHPFRTRRGSVGKPISGVEVSIADDGEILVRGANVTAGYYNAPEETAAAFRDGWFHTGDIGAVDAEGRLMVRGRKKEMIVTPDGLNVFPEDVERVVREAPGVRDAGVVAGGAAGREHVHAVLLLDPGTDPDAVVKEANARLEDHQRIRTFSVWPGRSLPRTQGTQKLKRRDLKRWVAGDAARPPRDDGPSTGRSVEEVVAAFAHGRTVSGDTTLDELGLSSIERIELMLALERSFDRSVDETALAGASTVADLRTLLAGDGPAPGSAALVGTDIPEGAAPGKAQLVQGGTRTALERAPAFPTWSQRVAPRAFRHAAQATFLLPLTRLFAWIRVEGLDRLALAGDPVLYAANHQSMMDGPVILASLPPERRYRVATAAAREWFAPYFHPERYSRRQRLTTGLAYHLGVLCFNVVPLPQREAGAREAMRYLGTLLGQGTSVLIFPEGRRCETGRIEAFQPGVGMLAARLQVPVVPVRIDGIDRILPVGARWARPGHARVAFGTPLRAEGDDYAGIARRIEAAVRAL